MITVGCVPYLNAKPLIKYFENKNEVEVILEVPSKLATMLQNREISAGLASSFEAFQNRALTIIPDISIASRGSVKSVRLFSKVPRNEIKTIALDASSLTSNALLKIILAEQYNIMPEYLIEKPDQKMMLDKCDACLLIGDPGMRASSDGLFVLDLGNAWTELTNLPFVWAVWLKNSAETALDKLLLDAKNYGVQHLEKIVQEESQKSNWPVDACREYLMNVMEYDLNDEHKKGLVLFQELSLKHGLINQQK